MICASYSRVSTQRQENEQTIETQLFSVKEYAAKNGHTIVKEYKDEGWSGTILARPSLDELRIDARKKMWEALIVYDPDRVARKYAYQSLIIEELEELGIKVCFVTTPPALTDEDRLLYGVKGIFAEYERTRITDRFRLGRLRKAREGSVFASEGLFGYFYIKENENQRAHYEVNEQEAKIVKMIFSFIANDQMTIRQVALKLKELEIKPRKSKAGVWRVSSLTNMLHNKTYIGEGHYNSSMATVPLRPLKTEKYRKVKKTSRRIRPESEWIKIPVPPIIDNVLFERTQKQLRSNYELCERNKKNKYLLSGLIYCTCGTRRNGEGPQKGKHLYYRCAERVHSFPLPAKCHERGINARKADELVWDRVKRLMTSPDLIKKQIKRWISQKQIVGCDNSDAIIKLKEQIALLKKEEEKYAQLFAREIITLEQTQKQVGELRTKEALLNSQIAVLSKTQIETDIIVPTDEWIDYFVKKAKEVISKFIDFEVKQKIARQLIEKVIANQKEMMVSGSLNLNYVKQQPDGRYRWISQRGEIDTL